MDGNEGQMGSERRFVLVDHGFEPRKIVRGTAAEILGWMRVITRKAYPAFLRSGSAFDEFNFPTKMPPAALRARSEYFYETSDWGLFEAENRIRWMEEHLGLELTSDEEHLRARVALIGAEVELFPQPNFWNAPDRCVWIEEGSLIVGPRPDVHPDSNFVASLKELLQFGVTTIVDASPEPDNQLAIAASCVEGQVPLRLLNVRNPEWIKPASQELKMLTRQDEVVCLLPGRDPGFFLDLLLHYLEREGLSHRDSLVRVFTRVSRTVFLPG